MMVTLIVLVNYLGTSGLLTTHLQLYQPIDLGDKDKAEETQCNKETREKQRLRKWTRDVHQQGWPDSNMAAIV